MDDGGGDCGAGASAFDVLGIGASADEDAVYSAFRRRALLVHPDKSDDKAGASERFRLLVRARNDALAELSARSRARKEDGGMSGPSGRAGGLMAGLFRSLAEVAKAKLAEGRRDPHAGMRTPDSHTPPVSSPEEMSGPDWAVYMANRFLSCTRARTLRMDLAVSLEDVYHARSKRVVIRVLRATLPSSAAAATAAAAAGGVDGEGGGGGGGGCTSFERRRQVIVVPLSGDRLEHTFEAAGDDAPPALLGVPAHLAEAQRGGVTVRVCVKDHPVYSVDTVVSPLDLHANIGVSLTQHYYGGEFELPHPSGELLRVEYVACPRCTGGAGDGELGGGWERDCKQVRCLHGYGLPAYAGEGHDADALKRGDLYVFFTVHLPRLDLSTLNRVRESISELDACDTRAQA